MAHMSSHRWFVMALALTPFALGCGTDSGIGTGPDNGGDGGLDGTTVNPEGGVFGGDSGKGDGGVSQNNCVAPSKLTLSPATKTAAVTINTAFTQAYTVTATYANQPTADVTALSFLSVSDPLIGTIKNGNVFTWAGNYGGTVTVSAKNCGVAGTATLTLNLNGAIGNNGLDPGVIGGQFNGAPPSTNASCGPTLVYPPDGVLLPPNTNVIEVHFLLGGPPPNNLFEVSFTNAVTNIEIYTNCSGTTAADGMMLNGGCVVELSQAEWDFIAQTNRNGDPLTVKVRAMGCDPGKVASSATRQIHFAKQDMVGALYYWASMRITVNTANYNSGGIFHYDFGVRNQTADPTLTPNSAVNAVENNCIGCHSVSRDGRQMVFDYDDNDDDDEYGDVFTDVYDLVNKTTVTPIIKGNANSFPPGYHTWNRTTKQFLLSDGPGNTATPNGAFARISPSGVTLGYAQSGAIRGTTPNWAPDDSAVAFASPPNVLSAPGSAGYWMANAGTADDLWFAGASLYVAPWDGLTKTLGAPALVFASNGTNNYYYPSYSPDGSFLSFNYVPSGANFHNPLARVELISTAQASPVAVDLAKLNDTGSLTNSWARWSPFVQAYKAGNILWITTSSTRDYGLRIQNAGKTNCYPTESPNIPPALAFTDPTANCTRAQIWMAAIDLDVAAVQNGNDVSWPAFWLPFQDLQTNNHLAQWAQQSFTGPCTSNANCGTGQCCDNGGCTSCPVPPPPNPTCASNVNCATGQCCVSGSCVACSAADAGPPASDAGGGCNTCLDCKGQACVAGQCGSCTNSSQCCAPLLCVSGQCIKPPA